MPTYILSKIERTGSGQKVADLTDVKKPPTELTALADDDQIPVTDTGSSGAWKYLKPSVLKTWILNGLQIAWSNVTGKPSTYPPSSHTHNASNINAGTLAAARLPTVPLTKGGTGATTAAGARTNLGLGAAATKDTGASSGDIGLLGAGGRFPSSMIPAQGSATPDVAAITDELISLATGDRVPVGDVSASTTTKWFSLTRLATYLAGVLSLSAARITSGTLSIARGGTGGATASAARTALGVKNFDLHDDVSTGLTSGTIANDDRLVITDESAAGDPMKYATAGALQNYVMNGMVSADLPTVPIAKGGTGATTVAAAQTALGTTDAGNLSSGTVAASRLPTVPIAKGGTGATTAAGARTNLGLGAAATFDLHDDVSTGLTSGTIANDDRLVITDESAAGDPMKYATAGALQNYVMSGMVSADLPTVPLTKGGTGATTAAGARTNLGVGTAATFDLHDDVGLFLNSGQLGPTDRVLVSDESAAGDPNKYTTVEQLKVYSYPDEATTINSGVMSVADKKKLNALSGLSSVTVLPSNPATNDVVVYLGTSFRAFSGWDAGIAVPSVADSARGVSVKANGDLVIVDTATNKIYTYDGSTWNAGLAVPSGTSDPQGVAVKANGDLVLVDSSSDKVYTYSGSSWNAGLAVPSVADSARGVSVKANGDLVIVDYTTDEVYTYSGSTWDAGLAVPLVANNPSGVAVKANGDLVLVDSSSGKVYTYSGSSWDAGIAVPSGTSDPRGVSVKANGDLVIVDAGTDKVYTALYINPTHPGRKGLCFWDGGSWINL